MKKRVIFEFEVDPGSDISVDFSFITDSRQRSNRMGCLSERIHNVCLPIRSRVETIE